MDDHDKTRQAIKTAIEQTNLIDIMDKLYAIAKNPDRVFDAAQFGDGEKNAEIKKLEANVVAKNAEIKNLSTEVENLKKKKEEKEGQKEEGQEEQQQQEEEKTVKERKRRKRRTTTRRRKKKNHHQPAAPSLSPISTISTKKYRKLKTSRTP